MLTYAAQRYLPEDQIALDEVGKLELIEQRLRPRRGSDRGERAYANERDAMPWCHSLS